MNKQELDYWADRMAFDRETRRLEEESGSYVTLAMIVTMVVAVTLIIWLQR